MQMPLGRVMLGHEGVDDPARRIDRDQEFPAVDADALDARAMVEFRSHPSQRLVHDGLALDGYSLSLDPRHRRCRSFVLVQMATSAGGIISSPPKLIPFANLLTHVEKVWSQPG